MSILSLGICTSTALVLGNSDLGLLSANRSKPASLDCSWYFNNEEIKYKSLYELNVDRLTEGTNQENVTTWGTVTCTYQYQTKKDTFNCLIIQSTDKYKNHASTVLFGVGDGNYDVGNVVSVTGDMTLYDGMSEMQNFSSIAVDYPSNQYEIEPLELTGPLPDRDSDEYNYYRYMGTREVEIKNVRLSRTTSSNKSYVYFSDDENDKIELFYGNNTNQSNINTAATNLNGKTVNIHGYLNCYNKKNLEENSSNLQVILRSVSDIEEVVAPEKEIDNLYVTTDKNFYYMDNITMSDFTSTINYKDGTSDVVSDAYIVGGTVDTSSTGFKTVNFAYERNGVIYEDHTDILINNTVANITVENPIQYYAFNEAFITPTVFGHSYGFDTDITDEVNFSGFDSYWNQEYHSNIFVDYTNSAGRVVSTSYEYYVSYVETIELVNFKTEYEIGEAFVYPDVIVNYTAKQNVSIDKSRVQFSGFDSSTPGTIDVTVSYGDFEDYYPVTIIDNTPAELYEYNVSISGIDKYDTGNYGESGDFEYYRAVNQSGYICKLIPLTRQPGCEPTLDGALYNINPIKDIDHITFTYKTSSSSGSSSPKLFYGENSYDSGSVAINYSTNIKETTIDLSSYDVNYIKFTCGDSTLYLKDIAIYYSGESTPHGYNFVNKTTGVDEYRIAPVTYSGTLKDGESYVDVPVAFDVTHSTVTAYKRYTYYSYGYVYENQYEHQEYISDATITDPVDVCNYFQAFGCAPANFGANNTVNPLADGKTIPSKSEVNDLFGSNARCISEFSKTTGYAQCVPYYGSKPTYYELDIDTNGQYRTSSRQVGRIVAWATGFKGSDYGYGGQIVCTYTDDHYSTFKEYNNFGGFLSRFNAEKHISGSVRGNPTTIIY